MGCDYYLVTTLVGEALDKNDIKFKFDVNLEEEYCYDVIEDEDVNDDKIYYGDKYDTLKENYEYDEYEEIDEEENLHRKNILRRRFDKHKIKTLFKKGIW